MTSAEPIFARDGELWLPSPAIRGPWDENAAHGGAPAALLAREVERVEPGAGMAVVRLTIDFYGAVPIVPLRVESAVVKPGRRLQVVEATLSAGDRVYCTARAVRLRRAAGEIDPVPAVPGQDPPPGPVLEGAEHSPLLEVDPGSESFFPQVVEIRRADDRPVGTGVAAAWFRLKLPVVGSEQPSGLQRAAVAADFSNGLSWVLPFEDWTFVNTELSVHLHREPEGEWIALDARTDLGPDGTGVASAVLSDRRGRIGLCAQSLYVERRR